MKKLRDTRDFMARRDLTLTESTGMLIDAAIERAKRQAEQVGEAVRQAQRDEIVALRRQVEQKRGEAAQLRRRIRMAVAAAACAAALVAGGIVGRVLWSDSFESSPTNAIEQPAELAR